MPYYKNVSSSGKLLTVRAQITTDAEAPVKVEKISKKQEEGVVTNKYRPKEPYVGRCLLNTKITGDDAPGETWHMVFTTEGMPNYISITYFVYNLFTKFNLYVGRRRRKMGGLSKD